MNKTKKTLFENYAKNFELITGEKNIYMCPLCLNKFLFSEVDNLTIEHIVPDNLGGKYKILTCKKCNNEFGSKVLSKFTKVLAIEDINSGKSKDPLDVELTVNEKTIKADAYFKKIQPPFEISFDLHNNRSNPLNKKYFLNLLESGQVNTIKMKINLGPVKKYLRMGIFISTYYLLFSYFGYFFVLNSSGQYLREDRKSTRLNSSHRT